MKTKEQLISFVQILLMNYILSNFDVMNEGFTNGE